MGQQVGGDAGAVVGDREPHHRAPVVTDGGVQADGDVRARRGVRAGVGEQVGDDLVQPLGVADDLGQDGVLLLVPTRQIQRPAVLAGRGVGVGDGVDDDPGEVDALARQRPAGVEAGEQQQVLDQPGHPHGLRPHPLEQARDLARQLVGVARGELVVAADRGERGAQLVAGVGDEAPQPGLALLPGGEGGAHVAEHPVERRADLADLGARVGVDVGHPVGELDLARGQRQLRDPARGGRDAVQRAQGQPGGDGRGHAGDHDADPEDDRLAEHQLADGVLQRVGGQTHDGDGAVLARGGGQPEAAEPLEVDGARRPARGRRDRRAPPARGSTGRLVPGRPSTTARTMPAVVDGDLEGVGGTVRAPADEAAARVRRWRPAVGVTRRRVAAEAGDLGDLRVELPVEVPAQRERRPDPDDEEDHGQQQDRGHDEPTLQRGHAPQHPPGHSAAGFSTYPAPRTVWIIGARPASIFLRR